jgi:hypothetical protein
MKNQREKLANKEKKLKEQMEKVQNRYYKVNNKLNKLNDINDVNMKDSHSGEEQKDTKEKNSTNPNSLSLKAKKASEGSDYNMDEGIITKDEIDALSSKFSTTEIGQSVDSQTDAPKLVEIATNTENHDSKNTSTIETSTNTEADNVITTSIETQTEKVSSSSIDTQIGFGSLSTSTLMSDSLPLSSLPLEIQQPMILDSPGLSIDFVNDITIPDGTRMAPGEAYTKVWRLQNTGSMQLPSNAKLVFLSGDKMSGPMTTDLPDAEAGQQFDITMDLVAPNEEGEYEGCWNITLVDSDSNDLSNIPAQMTLWVNIVVTQEVSDEVSDDSSWSFIYVFVDCD